MSLEQLATAIEAEDCGAVAALCDAMAPPDTETLADCGLLATLFECTSMKTVAAFIMHSHARHTDRREHAKLVHHAAALGAHAVLWVYASLGKSDKLPIRFSESALVAYASRTDCDPKILDAMLSRRVKTTLICRIAHKLGQRREPTRDTVYPTLHRALHGLSDADKDSEMLFVLQQREPSLGAVSGLQCATSLTCFLTSQLFLVHPSVLPLERACKVCTLLDLSLCPPSAEVAVTAEHFDELTGGLSTLTIMSRDAYVGVLRFLCKACTECTPASVRNAAANLLAYHPASRKEARGILTTLLTWIVKHCCATNANPGHVLAATAKQLDITARSLELTLVHDERIFLQDAALIHAALAVHCPIAILDPLFREHFGDVDMHGTAVKKEVDNVHCRGFILKGTSGSDTRDPETPADTEFESINIRNLCKLVAHSKAQTWLADLYTFVTDAATRKKRPISEMTAVYLGTGSEELRHVQATFKRKRTE
eukprot:TRINITY_DN4160_c3_g1_i2.p1 TRINITY_DN4160_c3_g1~~TRINITY_DN4160_c3_g1_i2.p1  ORF type:complete len:500 (+),score=66.04 TRINITY_DN4160_c3_g1_i2:50-1501(+)